MIMGYGYREATHVCTGAPAKWVAERVQMHESCHAACSTPSYETQVQLRRRTGHDCLCVSSNKEYSRQCSGGESQKHFSKALCKISRDLTRDLRVMSARQAAR